MTSQNNNEGKQTVNNTEHNERTRTMRTPTTFTEIRNLFPQAHIEEVDRSQYPYNPALFVGTLPELMIFTGFAIDPTDPERERLVWYDPNPEGYEPGECVPSSVSEMRDLLPLAFIAEVDGTQYPYNPRAFEESWLPELQIYTGLAIDPSDPDDERLVWFEPAADPGRFGRRVPMVLAEDIHPSLKREEVS